MLNKKDVRKLEFYEIDSSGEKNNFRGLVCECGSFVCLFYHKNKNVVKKFRQTDDSLQNAGIKKGDLITCQKDFDPLKDEGCLFVLSLGGGDMIARFVEADDYNQIAVYAANELIPDLVVFADSVEIVGIVIPKLKNPNRKFELWGDWL